MFYQIDDRLAEFSKYIWRASEANLEIGIRSPTVEYGGILSYRSSPIVGPETEDERFETINWLTGRPSRWLTKKDFGSLVTISPDGTIVGEIGFIYRDETQAERLRGAR